MHIFKVGIFGKKQHGKKKKKQRIKDNVIITSFYLQVKYFWEEAKKCLLSEGKYFSKEIQAGEKERKRKTNMAVILG